MTGIFLDTSAAYALADPQDRFHELAVSRFGAAIDSGRLLVTHSYVLSECMALLQARLGPSVAAAFAANSAMFDVEWIGPEIHGQAVKALGPNKRISFVDQVSFVVMRRRRIEEALAFDRDFIRAGFRIFGAPSGDEQATARTRTSRSLEESDR